MVTLDVNGQQHPVHSRLDSPLLWTLREDLGLRGTKYGCEIGICGTCTVHVDGEARYACVTTVAEVVGKKSRRSKAGRSTPATSFRPGSPNKFRNAAIVNRAKS